MLFIDHSTYDTPDRIREAAAGSACPVRVLHRPAGQRHGGLGGAVLRGLRDTSCDRALAIDADLQHPPEVVPAEPCRESHVSCQSSSVDQHPIPITARLTTSATAPRRRNHD